MFMIISHWILLGMRNVSDKSCRENENTHFDLIAFFPKIMPFVRHCGKMPDRPQMTIWCMRIARWITKATNTHNIEYCFSTATMVAWTRLNVTLYSIACLA
jgi:hypothetical protein